MRESFWVTSTILCCLSCELGKKCLPRFHLNLKCRYARFCAENVGKFMCNPTRTPIKWVEESSCTFSGRISMEKPYTWNALAYTWEFVRRGSRELEKSMERGEKLCSCKWKYTHPHTHTQWKYISNGRRIGGWGFLWQVCCPIPIFSPPSFRVEFFSFHWTGEESSSIVLNFYDYDSYRGGSCYWPLLFVLIYTI